MDTKRITRKGKGSLSAFAHILAVVLIVGVVFTPTNAAETHVNLSAEPGAPQAFGNARFRFVGPVMVGEVQVEKLPPQPFGSGLFYGVWFVRLDTDDKAFLGALINNESIIFSAGRPGQDSGTGETAFRATQFTTGPHFGTPITLGAPGTNLFIVLIEKTINGKTPDPVGKAVSGTF